ncbi:MAG TPA: chemotaxis protein CheW [Chloroflexota bacterium]|nr:chemotaxis protein CheW [Chloroflexota bacterium]
MGTSSPTYVQHSNPSPDSGEDEARLLLIGRIGDQPFIVPLSAVERVLPMAAPATVPGAPQGVVGVLHVFGSLLPVVDPHQRLGFPTPRFHPDQRLILVHAGTRYLLWMDTVVRIVAAQALPERQTGTPDTLVPYVAQVDGESIPVLSPWALDPGFVVAGEVVTTWS